jgi:hypothetical protein
VATANATLCRVLLGLTTTYPLVVLPGEADSGGLNTVDNFRLLFNVWVESGMAKPTDWLGVV